MAINLALGALGALLGAVLLWKFWALPRIKGWVLSEGASKLRAYLESVVESPDSEEAQQVGKLAGVAFAYIRQGIVQEMGTKEGREVWTPIWNVVQEHIMKSVFASWGHILHKLQEEGGPAAGALHLPPALAGLAQRFAPGIDPNEIMGLIQFLGQFGGRGNGNERGGGRAGGAWR